MGIFSKDAPLSREPFPVIDPAALADPAKRFKLLAPLHAYVEAFAVEQSGWYIRNRKIRQIASLWIRFFSLLFLFLGGLCPLIPKYIPISPVQDFGPWGYLLIGVGGGLLLFDRLFGISSSWMRFVWASLQIEKLLAEFRIGWMKTPLEVKDTISSDTFRALIVEAEKAITGIHNIVLLETDAWRTEFQSNFIHQMGLWKNQADGPASTDGRAGKNGHPDAAHKS